MFSCTRRFTSLNFLKYSIAVVDVGGRSDPATIILVLKAYCYFVFTSLNFLKVQYSCTTSKFKRTIHFHVV